VPNPDHAPSGFAVVRADDGPKFTVTCTCGWKSSPMSRAGLAHAVLDEHIKTSVSTQRAN